jgi:glutamate synthase domain-containing protein 1
MSDSASLDNVLEFLVMSGLSLPHAMAMLVPESFNEKNPISEDLKSFYEYHSILMERGTDRLHFSSVTDDLPEVCSTATVCALPVI